MGTNLNRVIEQNDLPKHFIINDEITVILSNKLNLCILAIVKSIICGKTNRQTNNKNSG